MARTRSHKFKNIKIVLSKTMQFKECLLTNQTSVKGASQGTRVPRLKFVYRLCLYFVVIFFLFWIAF